MDGKILDPDSFVSMNFWSFPGNQTEFLTVLEKGFKEFFNTTVSANPLNAEYLLPTIIGGMLREGQCTVKVLPNNDIWYGMTDKEDVVAVKEAFTKMAEDGLYRADLF